MSQNWEDFRKELLDMVGDSLDRFGKEHGQPELLRVHDQHRQEQRDQEHRQGGHGSQVDQHQEDQYDETRKIWTQQEIDQQCLEDERAFLEDQDQIQIEEIKEGLDRRMAAGWPAKDIKTYLNLKLGTRKLDDEDDDENSDRVGMKDNDDDSQKTDDDTDNEIENQTNVHVGTISSSYGYYR